MQHAIVSLFDAHLAPSGAVRIPVTCPVCERPCHAFLYSKEHSPFGLVMRCADAACRAPFLVDVRYAADIPLTAHPLTGTLARAPQPTTIVPPVPDRAPPPAPTRSTSPLLAAVLAAL